ncbi:MAG: MBL fold metallo-hydrolase [Candidatus Hydrogenedentota bacterium]
MDIRFYGVRGSLPSPSTRKINYHKYGGNTSCVSLVEDKDYAFILDAGSGIRLLGNKLCAVNPDGKQLRKTDFNTGRAVIDLFLGHLHWDHIIGLPFFKPIYIKGNRINIYGCKNLKKELPKIFTKPFFPLNFSNLQSEIKMIELKEEKILRIREYKILPIYINHPDPTFGYRIENRKGKIFVYATDTEHSKEWEKKLDKLCRGADALVYDTQYTHQEYDPQACEKEGFGKKTWGHSIVQEGIKLCQRNKVKVLIPFHYAPESPDRKIDDIMRYAKKIKNKTHSSLRILPAYEDLKLTL